MTIDQCNFMGVCKHSKLDTNLRCRTMIPMDLSQNLGCARWAMTMHGMTGWRLASSEAPGGKDFGLSSVPLESRWQLGVSAHVVASPSDNPSGPKNHGGWGEGVGGGQGAPIRGLIRAYLGSLPLPSLPPSPHEKTSCRDSVWEPNPSLAF